MKSVSTLPFFKQTVGYLFVPGRPELITPVSLVFKAIPDLTDLSVSLVFKAIPDPLVSEPGEL